MGIEVDTLAPVYQGGQVECASERSLLVKEVWAGLRGPETVFMSLWPQRSGKHSLFAKPLL